MNRTEFLARLRRALAGKLPEAELSDVLAYYEEYFADAGADGEAEAAAGLGSPESVAEQVLAGRSEPVRPSGAGRRLKKWQLVTLCICGAVILFLGGGRLLTAYGMPAPPPEGTPRESGRPAAESFLDDVMTFLTESETVVDLPRELYVVCPEYADKSVGRSSEGLRFDFWVEEPMEMRLEVVQRSGSLELGIQNREDGSWPYAQRPFTGEATDAVTLRPGSYSVMVEADVFQGSWHIQGEPVPAP